jgi:hypothetical protein
MVRRREAPSRTIWPPISPAAILRDAASRLLRMRSVGVVDEVDQHGDGYPTKRKRPWGAGVFVVNLGVVGVLIIHVATLGAVKAA